MRELSEEEIEEEAKFIRLTAGWPLYPLLPVKNTHRYEKDYEGPGIGLLLASDLTAVYEKNLMELNSRQTIGEQLKGVPVKRYLSVEAMVRHGWIGD